MRASVAAAAFTRPMPVSVRATGWPASRPRRTGRPSISTRSVTAAAARSMRCSAGKADSTATWGARVQVPERTPQRPSKGEAAAGAGSHARTSRGSTRIAASRSLACATWARSYASAAAAVK